MSHSRLAMENRSATTRGDAWSKQVGALTVPALLFLILLLAFSDANSILDAPFLIWLLNTVFISAIAFVVAIVAARGYWKGGWFSLLLLGCGTLIFGMGSFISGAVIGGPDGMNNAITIYSSAAALAALFHFGGAALISTQTVSSFSWRERTLKMTLLYAGVSAIMVLLTAGALANILPRFFDPGTGVTLLRQIVLDAAIVLFVLAALRLYQLGLQLQSDLPYWYALSLALIAIGLLALFWGRSISSPIWWVGRIAQYLGGLYLLAATLPALREVQTKDITLEAALRVFFREAKENYQSLFETATDAIIIIDQDIRILMWNSAAERMFGYSRRQAVGASLTHLVLSAAVANGINKLAEEAIRPGLNVFLGTVTEAEAKHASGKSLPVEFTVSVRQIGAGWDSILILRDITERKRAEEAIHTLNAELEDCVAERTAQLQLKKEELAAMSEQLWQTAKLATMGELAASIAHELNNPLATVSLRVESLLAQTTADDLKRRTLEIIEQEVKRMSGLIANLLQFSRQSKKQISTLDLREEIVRTLELIQYHLRNHNVRVTQEFAPDLPKINADRQQLRQLFLNLFTNASDAMPHGGTLTVRGEVADTRIVIQVADSGVGIAPENLSKVGEPFFTTKPDGKGTGLGLAICRRIVQEHGGTLSIASEGLPGKGTIVRVLLPLHASGNGEFLKET